MRTALGKLIGDDRETGPRCTCGGFLDYLYATWWLCRDCHRWWWHDNGLWASGEWPFVRSRSTITVPMNFIED